MYYCLNNCCTRENDCFDSIVTNMAGDAVDCKVVQPSLSDHSGVVASFNDLIVRNILKPSIKECLYKQVTVLNPYTFANFRDKLIQADWLHITTFLDVNKAYEYFINTLTLTISYNECCYLKSVKVNISRPSKE